MVTVEIQSVIDEIIAEPRNLLVEQAMADGRIPVGYTCSYVPEVVLSVDGLFPVRMRAPGIAGTEMADTYLSSVICSYTRSLLEFAMDGRYDFLGGWVFTAGCDHLRRLYDNLDYLLRPAFNRILDVPHKTGDAAMDWYEEELRMLAADLTDHFGVDTGDGSLARAVAGRNEFSAMLRAIGDLRGEDNPPITGTEFHRLMIASSAAPKDLVAERIEDFRKGMGRGKGRAFRARLMVVGSNLDDPGYTAVIEETGGLVVADRYCTGSMPGLEAIPEGPDPMRLIAEHNLRGVFCPRMMEEFASRVKEILRIAKDLRVDGVVIEIMKFCDTWGVEGSPLVAMLREAGMPVLRLERDYRLTGEGQLRTRIQAFLESMGK